MEKNKTKNKKEKPRIKQFLLKCTLDELLEIAPRLMRDFGFEIRFSPTDIFPYAVDFEEKIVFTVDKPSLIAPYLQSGRKYLTIDECKKVMNADSYEDRIKLVDKFIMK